MPIDFKFLKSSKIKEIETDVDDIKKEIEQIKTSITLTKDSIDDIFTVIDEDEKALEKYKEEISEKLKSYYSTMEILLTDQLNDKIKIQDINNKKVINKIITALCFVFAIGITALIIILKYIATGTF